MQKREGEKNQQWGRHLRQRLAAGIRKILVAFRSLASQQNVLKIRARPCDCMLMDECIKSSGIRRSTNPQLKRNDLRERPDKHDDEDEMLRKDWQFRQGSLTTRDKVMTA